MNIAPMALAEMIHADAARYVAQFNRDGTDHEFERLIDRDETALNAIADLAESGDLRAAYRRWARLDTVVREALSQRAWRGLTQNAAICHTEHD
jgi:hypothetical protein